MGSPFPDRLLAWYDRERRDLPWRRTQDPWAIWVSEVMLQQTRVEAVRAAWSRFLQRFPRPADFAAASDDQLQAAWRGLGYYRRARLLRDGARAVVREHGGVVPGTAAALGGLPGIGDYTRGAIASIAFGRPEPAIDGNVERVVARHRSLQDNVKSRSARSAITDIVGRWQPTARPGDFNQALMELGATVCTPRSPSCGRCPVARDCAALAAGLQERLPVLPARPQPRLVEARAILVPVALDALGHRLPANAINGGQIDLPGPGLLQDCSRAALRGELRARFGCTASIGEEVAVVRHAITRHRITLHVHLATVRRRGRLIPVPMLDPAVPWTTAARKVFARSGVGPVGEDR